MAKRITCAYCGARRVGVEDMRATRAFKYKLTELTITLSRWSMCRVCENEVFKIMADAAKPILNGTLPKSCFNKLKGNKNGRKTTSPK